jgi:hypothetical protein
MWVFGTQVAISTYMRRPAAFVSLVSILIGCSSSAPQEDARSDDEALNAGATCAAGDALDVVAYTEDGYAELAQAFADHPTPCGHYFISLPALAAHKDMPRGGVQPKSIRDHGPQFHAMAEFHWGGWHNVTNLTWYEKGVEFRRRMVTQGYDIAAGDTWAINEVPSTFRSDPDVRTHVREAIKGLFDGPPGAPNVRGAVFLEGMGSSLVNTGPYKANQEATLEASAFWDGGVTEWARWWGQETYVSPADVCVPGAHTGVQSSHINAFSHHVSLLAAAAPGAVAAKPQAFFERTYTPLLNMVARSDAYQTAGVSIDEMRDFVSTEVYAQRAWAGTHPNQPRRIGLGWSWNRDKVSADEIHLLARRVARSIASAYAGDGGAAPRACSPTGAFTFCQCHLAGAQFNEAWSTFEHW